MVSVYTLVHGGKYGVKQT